LAAIHPLKEYIWRNIKPIGYMKLSMTKPLKHVKII
jgi:hypothetical protein